MPLPAVSLLMPVPPFAFDRALDFFRTSPSAIAERIVEDAYYRAVHAGGRLLVLRVTAITDDALIAGGAARIQSTADAPAHDGLPAGAVRLRVEAWGEDVSAAPAIAARVFGTDLDIARLTVDAAADPVFAALVARFAGLRPVQVADPFETLVWAILGQQINVTFAATLKRALIGTFGRQVCLTDDGRIIPASPPATISVQIRPAITPPAPGIASTGATRTTGEADWDRRLWVFPEPEVLARLDHERDLRPLQFSRQKSEYIIGAARAVAEGRLDLDSLRTLPAEEAIARLTALRGIGRWTAEYLLMRGLGFTDIIPAGDGGLKRAVGEAYGLGRHATEAEVRAFAGRWVPWRSFAAFYWWFSLQLARRDAANAR